MYVSNIMQVLDQALPDEWAGGLDWYGQAHRIARRVAAMLGVSIEQAAFAIAALSPRTAWSINVAAIFEIAEHLGAGGSRETFAGPVSRRILPRSIDKAFAILVDHNLAALSGPKTTAFADNILHPETSRMVTVDSWAYRIAAGLVGHTDEFKAALRGKLYDEVAAAYIEVADARQQLPSTVQAVTWVTAHRLEGKS